MPPNMQQLQHPSHSPLLCHQHLPRPPPQKPLGMPGSIPGISSHPMPMPMPGPMGMQQGTMNQMGNPMPQGPFWGMNQMHSGSLPTSGGPPLGGFPNNLPNMQGPPNTSYPQGKAEQNPTQVGACPRPPSPHPSLLNVNKLQPHQQNHQKIPQHQTRNNIAGGDPDNIDRAFGIS